MYKDYHMIEIFLPRHSRVVALISIINSVHHNLTKSLSFNVFTSLLSKYRYILCSDIISKVQEHVVYVAKYIENSYQQQKNYCQNKSDWISKKQPGDIVLNLLMGYSRSLCN